MEQPGLSADYYIQGLRRNIWVIIGCVLAGLAIGAASVALLPKTYSAQAKVLVRPSPSDTGAVAGGRTTGQLNLDTEAQIATSQDVATLAGEALGSSKDPRALSDDLSVSVPANSSVLNFRYIADTPAEAAAAANAFAQSYLDNRRQNSQSIVDAQTQAYTELLAELNQQLAAATNDADRAVLLEQQIAVSNDLRSVLTTPVAPGRVISGADTPSAPTTPTPLVALAGGAALGLLAGLVIAAWRIRREDRTVEAADLRAIIPANHYVNVDSLEDPRGLHSLGELLGRGARIGKVSNVAVIAAGPNGAPAAQWIAGALAEQSGSGASVALADVSVSTPPAASADAAPRTGFDSGIAGAELAIWPGEAPMSDPLSRWDAEVADEVVIVVLLHQDRVAKLRQDFDNLTVDDRAFAVVTVDGELSAKLPGQATGKPVARP